MVLTDVGGVIVEDFQLTLFVILILPAENQNAK